MAKNIQKVNLTSSSLSEEKLQELRQILPEVFAENKIDWDRLRTVLGGDIDPRIEKFGFTWAGKSNAIKNVLTPSGATLRPDKDASINFDETENLFVEGDNLEVLKLLQKAYFEKIKVIYIDPPYNTGGDFVYKDNFASPIKNYLEQTGQKDSEGNKLQTNKETNGRYHSDWLSMMYSRLKLAWNLLEEDGVIFVSIDDNEAHHLLLLMNEVFGEENFVTKFIWEKTQHFGRQKINSYSNADYILCFAKNLRKKDNNVMKELLVEKINDSLEDAPLYNASNHESDLVFAPQSVKFNISDGEYTASEDEKYLLKAKVIVKNGFNTNELKLSFRSRWSQRMIDEEFNKGTTFWVKSKNFAIRAIYREDKTANNSPRQIIFTNKNNSLCTFDRFGEKIGTSEEGTAELKDLFGGVNIFDYPKPVSLILYLCSLLYDGKNNKHVDDGVFLDFFAGSGTLAHAVINLNKKDNGKRKWICVQLPEILNENNGKTTLEKRAIKEKIEFLNSINKPTNIAEISKERIRRAIDTEKSGGFKAFKLTESNYPENNFEFDPDKSQEENKKAFQQYLDKAKQGSLFEDINVIDVVYENIVKEGLSLNSKVDSKKLGKNTIFTVVDGERNLLVCLDKKVESETVKEFAGRDYKGRVFICIDNALDDSAKANLSLNLELKTI